MNTGRNISMIVLSMIASFAFAQERASLWTMDKCMKYAVEHSTDVGKKQYEASTADSKYHSAVISFFPTVTSDINGQYNWGRSINPETNTYNTVTTFNNSYELYCSLSLFDGGQTVNQWRQAKVDRQQGMNNIQKAKDDKAIEVMQAFIDVVYDQGCVELAKDKLEDSSQTLHKTECQEKLGIKGKPDVAQIKAQVAEDDYNLTHQQNLFNTALLKLKSTMNFNISDTLAVDTVLQSLVPELKEENANAIYGYASVFNPLARAAMLNVKNSQLQYHITKGKLLPALTLSAGVTTDYYRDFSDGAQTLSFGSQFKNNRGEYVVASLSIPIFDHTSRSTVKKAFNDMHIAMLEKDEALRGLQSDIEQAVMDRNGYVKEIIKMQKKVDADSCAYQVSHRKFEEGMLSAIDLHTSADALLQSRIELLQKRMLYVMKDRLVDYYKGNSLIEDNK